MKKKMAHKHMHTHTQTHTNMHMFTVQCTRMGNDCVVEDRIEEDEK